MSLVCVCVCVCVRLGGEGGLSLLPNFQKEGALENLIFYRGVAAKSGGLFFRGGLQFLQKN